MTAAYVNVLMTKQAAMPTSADEDPGDGGPDDAGAVEERAVERDRRRDVLAADHLDGHRLADRHVEGVHRAEDEREREDLPDLGVAGHGQDREHARPGRARSTG